jgi:hypothetical protein
VVVDKVALGREGVAKAMTNTAATKVAQQAVSVTMVTHAEAKES